MKTVKGYPVCTGCVYTSLHKCTKFNEPCPSFCFGAERHQTCCLSCLNNDSYEFGIPPVPEAPDKIAYFHVPGTENFKLFKSIIKMQEYYPEAFYPNRKISEIYGSFPGTIWNGRTLNYTGQHLTLQQIDDFRKEAEELGLMVNLTWNNHLVSGTDVYDRFCNNITEVFHNGKHAITVASADLFNYLKEKFPNFTYYQSVISTTCDQHFVKKDERYNMYLMNRNLNNNWDELLKVPENERHTIEFLCNDICTPICNRMGHYNVTNGCLLNRSDDSCLGFYCTVDHDFPWYNNSTWPITIKPEDIDTYLDNDFCHFKICSRGDAPWVIALKMAKYLALPQYVDDVFNWASHEHLKPEELEKQETLKYQKGE